MDIKRGRASLRHTALVTPPFPPPHGHQPPWQHAQSSWAQQGGQASPYTYGMPNVAAPAVHTRDPIALPPEAVPPATPPWTTAAAQAWAAIRAPWWATPYVPAAVVIVGVIGLASLPVDASCDANGSGCGSEWVLYVLFGGLLLAIAALFALPVVAIVGSFMGLGLALALYPPDPEDVGATWPWWLLLAGLGWAIATSVVRVTRVRDQRDAAEEAAGAVAHPVPAAVLGRTVQRALVRLVFGTGALVLCGLCVWGLADALADDREHARRADQVRGTIVEVDDSTVKLRVDGETGYRVSESDDYERDVGDRVDVLVDGDWTRLANERFDGILWWLGVLACGIPGVMLTAGALRVRRRAGRLRPGAARVGTLRVQVLFVDMHTVRVFSADDEVRARPLFSTRVVYWATPFGAYPPSVHPPQTTPVDLAKRDGDAPTDDPPAPQPGVAQPGVPQPGVAQFGYMPMWQPATWMPRACEAVIFGPPYRGAEFVMLIAREQDTPCVAVSARAVRPLRSAARPLTAPGFRRPSWSPGARSSAP